MLSIRPEQLAILRNALREPARRRIVQYLLKEHAAATDALDIAEIRAVVDDTLSVAYSAGFESDRDVAWLAAMRLELDPRFHHQPAVAAILGRRELTPRQRIEAIIRHLASEP